MLESGNKWQKLVEDKNRLFWILLSRGWRNWHAALHVVQPATVVRWHRQGFKYYWRWKSRGRGRPKIDPEIRHLIRRIGHEYVRLAA